MTACMAQSILTTAWKSNLLTLHMINSVIISILLASSSVQSQTSVEGQKQNDPETNSKSEGLGKIRSKRNLGQLLSLLGNTPYSFVKLANYGNWCGKGGDAMGDGSYVDGCDLCCKTHDLCYHKTRQEFPGCGPWYKIYSYTLEEEDSKNDIYPAHLTELESQQRSSSTHKPNPKLMAQRPSCLSKENEAPSCQQSTCLCDVNFTVCLMKEPCPPERVRKDGALWWLPV